jgi:aminomethyltransferase
VARLGESAFRLTSAEPNLRWLQDNALGLAVAIEDVSEKIASLSLQGPASRAILDGIELGFFRLQKAELAGAPVEVSRTGFTGDLGYEIWLRAEHALPVWDHLMSKGADHGIVAAGMLALDVARIEAGLMLIDVDYVPARKALIAGQTSSPFELDLAWTVSLDKERFVGREALAAEASRAPQWRFVGVEVDYRSLERLHQEHGLATRLPQQAWRSSVPLYAGGDQAGYATSGGWSPILKKYIALAHLKAQHAAPGTELEMEITVEHRRRRAAARVVKKPFFDPERKRG